MSLPGDRSDPLDAELFAVLAASHARFVGRPLTPEGAGPGWLFADAPFGVLAHTAEDTPRFVYANGVALAAFERTWDEHVGLPSRLSAEPDRREDRQRLLDAVERDGFFAGYRGRRISRTGRRFWIEDVTMWNLVDDAGRRIGQAARFTPGVVYR
ncbi:MEKHLA domain-containing protein [Patulibacter minatonensis]|uniref:MEKHLA domain-containing protein n=1 Tax=Patulibacter minatonensis TaxID=298163 RepID=UPI00047B9223